ncbi:EpsI family protein [Duganella sp. BJB1802]|uniref:exosortase-associated protein EpsI, B-type n=1 Tax=unclassified Duganella TaxID=2636909 RepID=UPI001314814E|nr:MULTISPECIES: exosortase-associated protein EpsI, B-type [unclassified Duganella]NVD73924.1 EpsI family protein [Duganella sp. BJB1802]
MSKTVVTSAVLALCMVTGAGAARWLTPTMKIADTRAKVDLEAMIPAAFGDWTLDREAAASVAPNAGAQAISDKIYDQVLSRTYRNGDGQAIMLTITYGSAQTQDLKAHRQEVCYGAQGFEIRGLRSDVISVQHHQVPVTRMFAVAGQRTEPVTYWFTMGDEVVMGRIERLMVQIKYSFAGVIPDGMLVRVSNITPDAEQGYAQQTAFLNDLMARVDRRAVTQLLGASPQAVLR